MATFNSSSKLPVYFFSHGGPTFMYEDDSFGNKGAWNKIKSIGKHIKYDIKPDFIIVVSAHWQSGASNLVEISIPNYTKSLSKSGSAQIDPTDNELMYDFYGFPAHMYKEQFHSRSSIDISNNIRDSLVENGFEAKVTKRSIDHGVWVPLKVAFSHNKTPEEEWDVDIPLIQVSLTSSDNFETHHKLGKVLSKYREKNGLLICSGMSVHNLGDIHRSFQYKDQLSPYVKPFSNILTKMLSGKQTNAERFTQLKTLKTNEPLKQLLYQGHPTLEHFMPIIVGSGAIDDSEEVKELYNDYLYSLGWGIYQFGTDVK